ncbi:MAG: aminotransferase class III-fold pyridoxal phosphate-dependent enzyme, partial [Candidatus Omnitrophica bacterium]|nr:aminotransferase class III-fold pyridoxal phosphate-dependent enzyme [Candidatus Omnitrophota bacterium]
MNKSGQNLWNRAKKLIPGGNQLLSKRSEMFLPGGWPAYYKKAKGCEVWDLDGNHCYDMSIMGIGSCVLGYADPAVNKAVKKAIDLGSMSTFNCYEEVELAEKLIQLHPWSQMARFARTGGEACAIAVRIARAHAKKDKVAFCGYHGWHDWYLSANLADSANLDGQLLPGLAPAGVPRALKGTSLPFNYGEIKELEDLVLKNPGEIGVIIMEVGRHKKVDCQFLKAVKGIARKIKAVLIFDEVSSGFRVTTGGMHLLYRVNPDIAILGKALGNGYPIAAIIGKKNIMEAAQMTFISSTYWTERVGLAAALEVIKAFKNRNVPQHLISTGKRITRGLKKIFDKYALDIDIVGLPAILSLDIKEKDPLAIKTVFTQEMLKRGFLATNVV